MNLGFKWTPGIWEQYICVAEQIQSFLEQDRNIGVRDVQMRSEVNSGLVYGALMVKVVSANRKDTVTHARIPRFEQQRLSPGGKVENYNKLR